MIIISGIFPRGPEAQGHDGERVRGHPHRGQADGGAGAAPGDHPVHSIV